MVIGLTNCVIAIALAVVGSLTFWPVQQWYDFYIPIVLLIAGYIGGIVLWWIFIDIYGRILSLFEKPKKVNKFARFLLCDGMRYICLLSNVGVKVTNRERLPKGQRFLLVQNHASKFDPMVVNGFLPKLDVAFITKPSNMKIPLAKGLMPRLFYQPIDREDPIQSLGVMRNSIELITNNVTSIGVYPEGTRHQDKVLGDFHEGVFNIALKAKCPLVVATASNTDLIHKNGPWKRTHVVVNIVKTYTSDELEGKTAVSISNEVKDLMTKDLQY